MVAFGSNPLTNGNGTRASSGAGNTGGTPGNHTPQDIWVGAEDNTGTHALQLVGRGLLDNTALTPLMADFLKLTDFGLTLGLRARAKTLEESKLRLYPVPFAEQFNVSFEVKQPAAVSVELFDEIGQKVQTVVADKSYKTGTHLVSIDGSRLKAGFYIAAVTINGQVVSKKTIKL